MNLFMTFLFVSLLVFVNSYIHFDNEDEDSFVKKKTISKKDCKTFKTDRKKLNNAYLDDCFEKKKKEIHDICYELNSDKRMHGFCKFMTANNFEPAKCKYYIEAYYSELCLNKLHERACTNNVFAKTTDELYKEICGS